MRSYGELTVGVQSIQIHFFSLLVMSRVIGKPVLGVPTRSDINRAVWLQKMAGGLKFWIRK